LFRVVDQECQKEITLSIDDANYVHITYANAAAAVSIITREIEVICAKMGCLLERSLFEKIPSGNLSVDNYRLVVSRKSVLVRFSWV